MSEDEGEMEGEVLESVDERETPDYWRRWIKGAKKAAEKHHDAAKAAWEEYESCDDRPYPIYWSSVKTLEPAYYSRTPKIVTEREFGIEDETAMTGCLIEERMGRFLVRETGFDSIMQKAVSDFIHADKATTQVVYSADLAPKKVRLQPSPDGSFFDEMGAPFLGEVFQDDSGFFGESETEQEPTNQKVTLAECSYDEILHTPEAKSESEIKERAYYFLMDKGEAEARFGEDVAKKINWKTKKDAASKEKDEETRDLTEVVGEYLEGWECWCLPKKSVYWISDQYPEGFLDVKPDPYGLKGFFPSPAFIISNRPSKTLYPKPCHSYLKKCIAQLHDQAERVAKLAQSIKRRALVDGGNEDLMNALNSLDEGEYIAMSNLNNIVEKGGLEASVLWVPVQELMKAITDLSALQDKLKNEFFEWFGVPDILRGATDPLETLGAQQIKSTAAHDRFKFQKKQIAQLARDSIELMTDLALSLFSDERIAEIVGYKYMTPEHQARFGEALQLVRDPSVRVVRIAIDTDSMSFVDEQMKMQKAKDASSMVVQGLDKINAMMQISPDYAAVGLQALLMSLDTMSPGKEYEDSLKKAVTALMKKAENPPSPPPPPPDYEMMKLQIEQQRLQFESDAKGRDLERKEFQVALQAQKQESAANQSAVEAAFKASQESFQQSVQTFMAELEAQRVAIEQFKAEMAAKEALLEEMRLAREEDESAAEQSVAESRQPQIPQVINITTPPVSVNMERPQSGWSIAYDEMGNAVVNPLSAMGGGIVG